MHHKLDEYNIIKFYGECFMNSRISLILELLDISLLDYILNAEHNMRLADIITVVQQVWHHLKSKSHVGSRWLILTLFQHYFTIWLKRFSLEFIFLYYYCDFLQLATAFDALKRIGVIHADVKPENIMMVDHLRQPFRVKLIDFGLAIFRSQAKQGRIHQTPYYR